MYFIVGRLGKTQRSVPPSTQLMNAMHCAPGDLFNQKSSASLLSTLSGATHSSFQNPIAPQNSKEWTTSLSPRSWENLNQTKSR